MWGVGPCGRPRGARAHTPPGPAGSHKGPHPYALHLIMAQNLPLRACRTLVVGVCIPFLHVQPEHASGQSWISGNGPLVRVVSQLYLYHSRGP